MNGKREFLKNVIEKAFCYRTTCLGCPYRYICYSDGGKSLKEKLARIGAMAILRMFPKKEKTTLEVGTKIRFDNGKLYTIEKRVDLYKREEYCLRDKNTMVCYSIDYLIGKNWEVVE